MPKGAAGLSSMEFDPKDVDLTLFEPTARELTEDYPELVKIKEFKPLSGRDLKFVWYVANRTSPLVKQFEDEKMRIVKAVDLVYKGSLNEKKIKALKKGKFDASMMAALKVMSRLNPSIRFLARMSLEIIFERYQRMLMVSDNEIVDIEDKKRFVSMMKMVSEEIPSIVAQLEGGFGVRVTLKGEEVPIVAKLSDIE